MRHRIGADRRFKPNPAAPAGECLSADRFAGMVATFIRYLREHPNISWSYWPLNGTQSSAGPTGGRAFGSNECYGPLEKDWTAPSSSDAPPSAVLCALQSIHFPLPHAPKMLRPPSLVVPTSVFKPRVQISLRIFAQRASAATRHASSSRARVCTWEAGRTGPADSNAISGAPSPNIRIASLRFTCHRGPSEVTVLRVY
jgi:hypothetical protein